MRVLRDEDGQSSLRGLYPAGEGAGHAGGIVSAAVDGLRAAEVHHPALRASPLARVAGEALSAPGGGAVSLACAAGTSPPPRALRAALPGRKDPLPIDSGSTCTRKTRAHYGIVALASLGDVVSSDLNGLY